MARVSAKATKKNALQFIKSEVRMLRSVMKKGNLDERVWDGVGDNYWFKLSHYPGDTVNFVIRASRSTRRGFTFELFAIDDSETYSIPIDTVELIKESENLYLLEFEGEKGGYIYPIFSEFGF